MTTQSQSSSSRSPVALSDSLVTGYDRSKVSVGIVHIGAGRFHRAHEALYVQELLAAGHLQWGISAVYILPFDAPMVDKLRRQNGLYTLVERDQAGERAQALGSIVEVLYGVEDAEAVIERLASPSVKIVTFTVTEAGYFFEASSRALLLDHAAIQHDLNHWDKPSTLYGYLAAGLQRRRERGVAPFTVQCCDNLQGNGDLTRALFLSFLTARQAVAAAADAPEAARGLSEWVAEHVAFPNSMVDRITPAADAAELAHARDKLRLADEVPVTAESYRQVWRYFH